MSDDLAERELKSPPQIAQDGLNVFMKQLAPYAMAGIGQMIASLVVVFGGMFVMFAFIFGSAIAGVALAATLEMEALAGLCTIFGYLGGIGAMLLIASILGPVQASLLRAAHAHLKGEGELTIGSAFSTVTHRAFGAVMLQLALVFLSLFLLCFCYVPVLLVPLFFSLAPALYAIEDRGVIESLTTSAKHVQSHMGWHIPFFAVGFLISLIGGYIPVIGPMFHVRYIVDGYEEAFGKDRVTA